MSIRDFNNLTHLDKTRVILYKAIPLMKYTEPGSETILYSLNAHFIEVSLKVESEEVENITILKIDQLDKYISNVKCVFSPE